MARRTLEVTLISAEGLDDVNLFSKMHVYAVASIAGDRRSRQRTASDKSGGTSPSWNATLRFVVPPAAAGLVLHVLLRSKRALGDRDVGVVRIPLKEILGGRSGHPVSYQVLKPSSGKPKGVLNLSCKFVDAPAAPPVAPYSFPPNETKSDRPSVAYQPVPAYPPRVAYHPYGPCPAEPMRRNPAGTSAACPQPAKDVKDPIAGEPVTAYPASAPPYPAPWAYPPPGAYPSYAVPYGYPPARGPMSYGRPPPPPPAAQKPKKGKGTTGPGMGLLFGALSGLLIGDMMVGAAGAGF